MQCLSLVIMKPKKFPGCGVDKEFIVLENNDTFYFRVPQKNYGIQAGVYTYRGSFPPAKVQLMFDLADIVFRQFDNNELILVKDKGRFSSYVLTEEHKKDFMWFKLQAQSIN